MAGRLQRFRAKCFSSLPFSVVGVPPLPDKNDKVKENVCGTFYVDQSCIDCDVCRDTAPENFTRCDENNYSFVFKQPETEEERRLCDEAMTCCPVEAIGNDG